MLPTLASKSVKGYDRLSKWYRWIEWMAFGRDLQRSRVRLLNSLPMVQDILVLGDGDGRLLSRLCLTLPSANVTSVDQSRAMLQLQRRRVEQVGASDRVTFVNKDLTDDGDDRVLRIDSYDLVVAAFFLDCFTEAELAQRLPRWLQCLRSDGFIYVADFVQPSDGVAAAYARIVLRLMHAFFQWQTGLPNRRLIDFRCFLSDDGFVLMQSKATHFGMIQTEIWRRGTP